MNRISLPFIILLIIFTSCSKKYTCTCDIKTEQNSSYSGNMTTNSTSTTTIEGKKDEAKSKCEGSNGTVNQDLGSIQQSVTTTCTLK